MVQGNNKLDLDLLRNFNGVPGLNRDNFIYISDIFLNIKLYDFIRKIHLKNKSGYGTIKVSIQTFFVWQGGYYLDFFPRGTGWDTFFGKMLYILL